MRIIDFFVQQQVQVKIDRAVVSGKLIDCDESKHGQSGFGNVILQTQDGHRLIVRGNFVESISTCGEARCTSQGRSGYKRRTWIPSQPTPSTLEGQL